MKHLSLRNKQAWMLAAALLASAPALHAATTDIANAPPVATASGVKPNVMFLLDDSGSMTFDHLPDNVGFAGAIGGGNSGFAQGQCRFGTTSHTSSGLNISEPPSPTLTKTDCGGNTSSVTLETLLEAGVPYFAKEYNGIFYNPTITYAPPLDYDGTNTTYKTYNNGAGFLWASVKDNPFPGGPATTKNLDPSSATKNFPEQIFCDGSQSGLPTTFDAVHCRRNLMINPTFSITLASVVAATARATLANHGCQIGDKVTISGVSQANYNGTFSVTAVTATTFDYTKNPSTATAPTVAAGKVIVSTACNIPITKLSTTVAGSFTIITAVYPIPHGCNSGEAVTFKALGATNPAYSGGPASVSVVDERTLTYTIAFAPPLLPVESTGGTAAFVAESSLCAGTRSNYSTSTTVPPLMQGFPEPAAGKFVNHILLNSNPHYFTIGANEYCTDENLTKCEAPISETIGGVLYNVPSFVRYCAKPVDVDTNPAAFILSDPLSPQAEKGCHRVWGIDSTSSWLWPGVARYGYFTRTDIVTPTTTTYPKVSTRIDCSGAVGPAGCSYTEELTNFANWYAYYRTRIQMVKSAAGLAFKNLSPGYRVGFNSINAAGSGQYLPVAPFALGVGGQRQNWYTKLYSIVAAGGTPSRAAVSRIGRYFAGMKTAAAAYMTDDPIEASCQQNFTFFTTDGYWTSLAGYGGVKLDGTAMTDQDCLMCTLPPGASGTTPRPILDVFNAIGDDSKGTLSDVTYYYYKTDLRTGAFNPTNTAGLNVTQNNVSPTPDDPAQWQHMVTFTMGLGLDSTLIYKAGYATPGTSPDFDAVIAGTKDWPRPIGGAVSAVDDLWHAAVSGHGTYFSARNPANVVSGIASAFATVARRNGAVAAPATSNPNLVPGDNFLFTSTFTTLDWFSEVKRRQIDLSTGAISSTVDWTAQAQLDARTTANSDSRIIKTFDSANAATHLRSFAWANLTATEKTYFDGTLGGKTLLGQWPILTGAQQTQCDAGGTTCGEKLVNYLRGQRGFETTVVGNTTLAPDSGTNSLFRNRAHILGDIVNAEAVYVRQPIFNYGDQGYIAFKSAQTSRPGTLYTAANDGMLHALDANTGGERWTYIPTMVMPNMWHLADFDYANNHIYLVDGTPTTGDICTSNCSIASAAWATLLVGGLNAGGRGFYALDITDPLNPKALWELKSSATCIPSVNNVPQAPVPANTFSDCDIGLSFGNPIITKRADGKWVVLLSSGYNNVSPGTGGGFLYIVDAVTGAILSKVATLILNPPGFAPAMINAGNTTTPSGFAKINAFAAHTDNDNTSLRVYGGDLNGNLWRIDDQFTRNTLSGGVNQATLLAILGTANALNTQGTGTANTGSTQTVGSQSITTKPELGEILVSGVGTFEMVYVGTGRYLGTTDPAITNLQSFYGIKDPLGTFSGHGAVNGSSPNPNMVKQTITEVVNGSVTERHVTALTVNYTSKIGWFINFNPGTAPGVSPGERSNTDPSLDLGILSFTTNAPNVNACDVGGKSYIYFLDYTTGGPLPANLATGLGGQLLDNSLASRVVVIRVGDMVKGITVVGSQPDTPIETTLGPAANPVGGKRIYWRELNF